MLGVARTTINSSTSGVLKARTHRYRKHAHQAHTWVWVRHRETNHGRTVLTTSPHTSRGVASKVGVCATVDTPHRVDLHPRYHGTVLQ